MEPAMNQELNVLRFYLISAFPHAYLVGRRDNGPTFTIAMSQTHPGFWFAEVPLAAGTYRTRFYSGDGSHMFYCGPASSNGSWSDGLDAVVRINSPEPAETIPVPMREPAESPFQGLIAAHDPIEAPGYMAKA
jgi:hypothetical protein